MVSKPHKITIKQKDEAAEKGRIMHGATTEVLIDGKPITGLTNISFEVGAKELAKVTMTMFGDVEIFGNILGELGPVNKKLIKQKLDEIEEVLNESEKS